MTRHISPSASPTVDNEERSQCVLCLKTLAYPTVLSQTSWDATWRLHIQNTKRGLLIFLKKNKRCSKAVHNRVTLLDCYTVGWWCSDLFLISFLQWVVSQLSLSFILFADNIQNELYQSLQAEDIRVCVCVCVCVRGFKILSSLKGGPAKKHLQLWM